MCSISIHAPAKGATRTTTPPCLLIISIHAPAKGATSTSTTVYCSFSFQSTLPRRERRVERWRYLLLAAYFNPRSREGSDGDQLIYVDQILSISIHAPAKGATACIWRLTGGRLYFNPRSREGSDHLLPPCYQTAGDFNPRSREGSDNASVFLHLVFGISIHAPAKGATSWIRWVAGFATFQSTLPRRERHGLEVLASKKDIISIHAPAKGATAFINIFSLTVRLFLFHLTNKI